MLITARSAISASTFKVKVCRGDLLIQGLGKKRGLFSGTLVWNQKKQYRRGGRLAAAYNDFTTHI